MPNDPPITCDLSVVIPVKDEVENIDPLVGDIVRHVDALGIAYEIVIVNDGSTDGTAAILDKLAKQLPRLRIIHFAANFGQTAALAAGLEAACGARIVTMDGDRQNDPADIGALLKKLDEGYGCVSGWRKDRQDSWVKRIPSRIANRIIGKATSLPLHDYGCTLKAYRRDALDPSVLYGEMHRFLPVYVRARGGAVAEMVVRHHPRRAGVSKYGISRTARVMADLALVRLLFKYRTRPVHLFAKVGQYFVLAAAVFGLIALVRGLSGAAPLLGGAFLASLMLCISAVMLVGIGLCCELVMRNHFYVLGRRPWKVDRLINIEHAPAESASTDELGDLTGALTASR